MKDMKAIGFQRNKPKKKHEDKGKPRCRHRVPACLIALSVAKVEGFIVAASHSV